MAEKNLHINIGLGIEDLQKNLGKMTTGLALVKSALRAVFRTAIVAGFFMAIRAGFNVLSNFQNSLEKLAGDFGKLNYAAVQTAAIISEGGGGFQAAFEEASQSARKLSMETGFTAGEIQAGLYTSAQAALNFSDSLKVTQSALQLATVGGEDFQGTLNDLIGITRAFGVSVKEVPQFADALTAAMIKSKATLGGLFEGLRNVASIAGTAFGETRDTFLDSSAALMVLNDAGIEGSSAGTKLRAAMQKLLGGTVQTTAAFTKYGINLFQADAASQGYLRTLLSGQKVMASTQEELNALKQKQFDLIGANQQGSREFATLTADLDKVSTKLFDMQKNLDDVYNEFTLAGGKLRPFADVLNEIGTKAPTEVIGRAFGIRGGEAIMRVLNNLDKFNRFKTILKEYVSESEKGKSITQTIFGQFVESVLIRWQKMKNSVMAIFGVIADSFFSALAPIMEPVQKSLNTIFESISRNKGSFANVFKGAAEALRPALDYMSKAVPKITDQLAGVFVPGKEMNFKKYAFSSETGKIQSSDIKSTGDVTNKLKLFTESLSSLFIAVLSQGLMALKPIIDIFGAVFSASIFAELQKNVAIFKSIGAEVARGFVAALGEMAVETGKGLVVGGSSLAKTALGGFGTNSTGLPAVGGTFPNPYPQIPTTLMGLPGANNKSPSEGTASIQWGKGPAEQIDLSKLNTAGMENAFDKMGRAVDTHNQALTRINTRLNDVEAEAKRALERLYQGR